MKYLLIIINLLIIQSSYSQDFGVYPRLTDDKVKLPFVHESLKLSEFQLLSRSVRMMDMAYAAIVPGYIHFKAKEKTTGYILLSLRSVAYIGLGYSYFNAKSRGDKTFDIFNTNQTQDQIKINNEWSVNTEDIIDATAITIILSTYLYDWIHGKYKLGKKQELIRYKYSIKLKIEENKISFNNSTPYNYGLALTLTL